MCHNPYFNRWFSAIKVKTTIIYSWSCHNPYFNRWFSAILKNRRIEVRVSESQSLF